MMRLLRVAKAEHHLWHWSGWARIHTRMHARMIASVGAHAQRKRVNRQCLRRWRMHVVARAPTIPRESSLEGFCDRLETTGWPLVCRRRASALSPPLLTLVADPPPNLIHELLLIRAALAAAPARSGMVDSYARIRASTTGRFPHHTVRRSDRPTPAVATAALPLRLRSGRLG